MKFLFVHQNAPGQFLHLAPLLARRGHEVRFLTIRQGLPAVWGGVKVIQYRPERGSTPGIHPWVGDLETKVIRGEAAFRACLRLRTEGYEPDVVLGHPGWGECLFIKDVWPTARLGLYCEFFYQAHGADVGFDPEFPSDDVTVASRMRMKNANIWLHLDQADAAWSPTQWQAGGFPQPLRQKIAVMHDGIDTRSIVPAQDAVVPIPGSSRRLTRSDEVITFVNRNLEPGRGYHVFMRTLPELLRARPRAQVLLVGGDGHSYGPPPAQGTWKQRFADEARRAMDDASWRRVHFVGRVPHDQFIRILQVSTVHVYLTYPFVLSWSLIEAMSAGCAIVASDVEPVREAVQEGETGRLVPFFDQVQLRERIIELLDDPAQRQRLGKAAREAALARYDLLSVCLPGQLRWLDSWAGPV